MRFHCLLATIGIAASVRAVDLDALRVKALASYTKSSDVAGNSRIKLLRRGDSVGTAIDLIKSIAPNATFRVKDDSYLGANGLSHVFLQQTVHDVDIDNAILNVNIDREGNVFSYGNSLFAGDLPKESPKSRRLTLDPVGALEAVRETLKLPIQVPNNAVTESVSDEQESYLIKNVEGAETDPAAKQVYLVKPEGKLVLAWKIQTIVKDTSFSSYVDIDAGASEVVAVLDHVDYWSYEVYPFGLNDPREGERTTVDNPQDSTASPFGWHDPKNTVSGMYDTEGNNVMAGAVPVIPGNFKEARSPNESFIFPYTPDARTPDDSYEAAVTQAFYTTNMLHDLYYLLGFTPAAGNYQKDNNGEGGRGNDPVQVNLQTAGGKNNGKFQQSADGGRGILTMYLFNHTDPERDSAFDNGFIIHEYTHGMSDRLTGGASTTGCLNAWEADGMAEGWSDLFAAALTIKPSDTSDTATYGFAAWSLNQTDPPTARLRMYSTNMDVNEFTYASANGLTKVHEVGTVWATMLYESLWNLINKHGKNDNSRPDLVNGVPTDGKFLMLKLLIDAFAIQPCNPSMVQARDAIIDADVALTGGGNRCEIWKGFAKRGLGAGAVTADPRVDNFDLPEGVC
ncbi:unnamed protein product [Clonostachys chloroleuca]|uniref:Extracellular metalloproteinase n=1 Tax=Clonostachys chloroleuca TaxID=1926264 RepID=A0AA35M918_9HYPO|nr:unnamed protein product [Clonostachys chloroleuca]